MIIHITYILIKLGHTQTTKQEPFRRAPGLNVIILFIGH